MKDEIYIVFWESIGYSLGRWYAKRKCLMRLDAESLITVAGGSIQAVYTPKRPSEKHAGSARLPYVV